MKHNACVEEVFLEDITETSIQNFYNRLKWLLVAFLLFVPAVIFVSVKGSLIVICLLAWLNCVVIAFAVWRFVRKGTLAAMIPVVFLSYITVSWPISMIYFAIFYPEQAYPVFSRMTYISFFDSGVKVQLCVLLFLAGYLGVMFYLLRKERQRLYRVVGNPRLFVYSTILLDLSVILFHAVSYLVRLPDFLSYLIACSFRYFWGLIFIAGVLITKILLPVKVLLIMALAAAVFFYTVGNARGYALFTIFPFIFGIVFFSEYGRKTKLIIAFCLILSLPMYLFVSNATRLLTGTVGFGDFWYRVSVLKQWREAATERSAVALALDRAFSKSGHSIIARTPSEVPYRYFAPLRFFKEAIMTLLPQQYFYYPPYYGDLTLLSDYGFLIITGPTGMPGQTSTEISMIGSLWMMGGWPSIILGGVCLGLLHGFLVKIIQRSSTYSMMKALVYFSLFIPPLIWGPHYPLMWHWHYLLYSLAFAFILYQILRWTIGDPGREMYRSNSEEQAAYTEQSQR